MNGHVATCLLYLLASIVPPPTQMADLNRFPNQVTVRDTLRFAREFRDLVAARITEYPQHAELLWAIELERARLYGIWDVLDDAHAATSEEWRLYCLERLRALLGEHSWQLGLMPPPVPIWRFREMGP